MTFLAVTSAIAFLILVSLMDSVEPYSVAKVNNRPLKMVGKALDYAEVNQDYIFEGLGYTAYTCPEWIPWEDWVQIMDRLAEEAGSEDRLREIGYQVFKGPAALFLLRLVGSFADLSNMLMRMNELIMRTFFKGLVFETRFDKNTLTCEAQILIPEGVTACRSFLVMSSSAYEAIFQQLKVDYDNFDFTCTDRMGTYTFKTKRRVGVLDRMRRVYRVILGADFAVRQIAENEDELRRRLEIVEAARAEAEMLRAKEHTARKIAEEALQVRQRFLGVMSHELRTPLNHIIGCASILTSEDIDEAHKEYIEIINRSAYNLLDLIEQVLDFTSAGTLSAEKPSAVLLSDLLDPLIEQTRHACAKKEIDFEYPEVEADDAPFFVYVEHLKRIVKLLLENAVKFTNEGGVRLDVEKSPTCLEIIVSDTGIGIPQEWQHEVFEPFRAVDSSDTRAAGGIGLGLTIARKLAVEIGGELELRQSSLTGSVFSISVPIDLQAEKVEASRISPIG